MHLRAISFLFVSFLIIASACDDDDKKETPEARVEIEGTSYRTVEIGAQTWTSENYAGPGGVPFDEANSIPEYGKYYSREEISSITLPEGWRIPTQQDYHNLAEAYGITLPSHGTQTDAVKALVSKTNWNHVSGTNTSGFNAMPAGYIFAGSAPIDGDIAEFWTSEGVTLSIQEAGKDLTALRMIFYQSDNSVVYRFNVRFVKD